MAISCKSILLVEDNPDHADLTMDAIRHCKISNPVIWVKSAEEALDYLKRRGQYEGRDDCDPALLLLDIKLPGMSGLDLLKIVRADEEYSMLPVVMLTTSDQEGEVLQAYMHHANSYVVKPMKFEDFYQRVQELNIYWMLTNLGPTDCARQEQK